MLWLLPLVFLPLVLFCTVLLYLRWRDRRDGRRLPVDASGLPNLPGAQVRQRLDDASDEFSAVLAGALFVGPLFLLVALLSEVEREAPHVLVDLSSVTLALLGLAVLAVLVLAHRGYRHLRTMRQCREGLAAELTTAYGLQSLIPEGLLVFHDIPADGFNIDHVVVGRSVVFAVETKSRKKPAAAGKASARVQYDGRVLRFPEHVETKPLEQAVSQARWLAEYLSGATGNPVRVIPVLALPGWFVEQKASPASATDEVRVINPKNPAFMHKLRLGADMAEDQRRRIAFALNKRYGDVAGE